ncbi:hypothetical protein ZOSMA_265G00210 [Zostera marina]|uniref:Glycine-rich protein n=1 Tax=Zostera marina TaxID=29655 RepID=A0A0K9PH19_ZOSMR|nr:hypothetical protein ZOSMA_265G00210 [Zostera marina]
MAMGYLTRAFALFCLVSFFVTTTANVAVVAKHDAAKMGSRKVLNEKTTDVVVDKVANQGLGDEKYYDGGYPYDHGHHHHYYHHHHHHGYPYHHGCGRRCCDDYECWCC